MRVTRRCRANQLKLSEAAERGELGSAWVRLRCLGRTLAGGEIAIRRPGEFCHTDRHCVAPFVAEREQKEPTYQRLLGHKHKWLVLERVKGIEPSYSAWKAAALPLSYTRAWAIT